MNPQFWRFDYFWSTVNYLAIGFAVFTAIIRLSGRPMQSDRERGLIFGFSAVAMSSGFLIVLLRSLDVIDVVSVVMWAMTGVLWLTLPLRAVVYRKELLRTAAEAMSGWTQPETQGPKRLIGSRKAASPGGANRRRLYPFPHWQAEFLRPTILVYTAPLVAVFFVTVVSFDLPLHMVLLLVAVAAIFSGIALVSAVMTSARWIGALVKMVEQPGATLRADDPVFLKQLSARVQAQEKKQE